MTSFASLTGNNSTTPGVDLAVRGTSPASTSRGARRSLGIILAPPHMHKDLISSFSQSTARTATREPDRAWGCCNTFATFAISGAKCWQCGHHGAKNSSSTYFACGRPLMSGDCPGDETAEVGKLGITS
eukprot:CAMPEP_0115684694 /NCGR_PEP_ID=MMETSP0272-20121206/59063_1 /TAXON_ID=71861 /ORGANISM="Scrippsiella trochoidea, Strain CCMP3099" /LENGTH=128 /DNA_ID=CAMNT_0003124231 /DNA_START=355 /DNA_END=741 /DNA_ORIENTATION=+